nr:hypothetical protein [Bradyrhizobium japonicum]
MLALALALFHLGNAAVVPLYGLAAVAEDQANGPSFVATTVVIAQGVMIVTSLVAMSRTRRLDRAMDRLRPDLPAARRLGLASTALWLAFGAAVKKY